MRRSPVAVDAALVQLGMPVPDSALARRARELIATAAPPFLVNHSVRSYAWAVGLAESDGLRFDPEILYVSAVLHDLGLAAAFDTGRCFEIDGALAAERLASEGGWTADRAVLIRDPIAFHMAAELPPEPSSETVLLDASTGVDVSGRRLSDVPSRFVPPILAAYPRLDFKREFSRLFVDQAERKPTCRVAEMVRGGFLTRIESAPFDS